MHFFFQADFAPCWASRFNSSKPNNSKVKIKNFLQKVCATDTLPPAGRTGLYSFGGQFYFSSFFKNILIAEKLVLLFKQADELSMLLLLQRFNLVNTRRQQLTLSHQLQLACKEKKNWKRKSNRTLARCYSVTQKTLFTFTKIQPLDLNNIFSKKKNLINFFPTLC